MRHITKIYQEIAQLEYNKPADCVELRLYLLSLMREFVSCYTNVNDKQKAAEILKSFRELENLYKSFTALTLEPGRNYKAQFEFAKALIGDQMERTSPAFQVSKVA